MILIIGYGNSLRGDDGAGLLLAEGLEEAWQARQVEVERLAVHQLTPELTLEISREEVTSVVFVDTRAELRLRISPQWQVLPILFYPVRAIAMKLLNIRWHVQAY